ncbi:MAG: ComF family protein [Candidatus Margulisiibacteriota bacterium]
MIKLLLDMLFPPRCAVCRTAGDDVLCQSCGSKIVMIRKHEGYVFCVGAYEGVLERAIKLLKFHGKKRLAQPLGQLFANHNPYLAADAIIPVPLHPNRLRERGFNQSALISTLLAEKIKAPVLENVLVRKKDTKHLFELGKLERQKTIEGAFEVASPHVIRGASLILVDDIYTTGVTTETCRKTLLEAGAISVKVLVLSRARLL